MNKRVSIFDDTKHFDCQNSLEMTPNNYLYSWGESIFQNPNWCLPSSTTENGVLHTHSRAKENASHSQEGTVLDNNIDRRR